MEVFISIIRKDPKVRVIINDTLDRYMRLPYKSQSKRGYGCLIQISILKELLNIMGSTMTDLDIELKMKIIRIEYSGNKKNLSN